MVRLRVIPENGSGSSAKQQGKRTRLKCAFCVPSHIHWASGENMNCALPLLVFSAILLCGLSATPNPQAPRNRQTSMAVVAGIRRRPAPPARKANPPRTSPRRTPGWMPIRKKALTAPLKQQHPLPKKTLIARQKEAARMVRQCSCDEQHACIGQMQTGARDCFHTCWTRTNIGQITRNPSQLKQCLVERQPMLDQFIECSKSSAQSCVNTKNGPMIMRRELQNVMGVGERRIRDKMRAVERTALGAKNKQLIQVAVGLGTCIRDCFVRHENQDSCFVKSGCQPKLDESLLEPTLKRCGRKIGWKKGAAELCQCALQTGISSLKDYCKVLKSEARGL